MRVSDMDTYKLRVMHCPICEAQATHRAVSAFPATSCPKCHGTTLGQYMDGKTFIDGASYSNGAWGESKVQGLSA